MKCFLLLLATLVGLASGCIPLRQQKTLSGPGDVSASLCDTCDQKYLTVMIGRPDLPKRQRIQPEGSYVQSPGGTRYGIQVEPHKYDIEQKFPYVRDDVYLVDANGVRVREWSNGIWKLHFVVETGEESSTIEMLIQFWTFHYNPIIHGPPN